ncbi:TPA: hypothetical protein ACIYY4_001836, partial [Escherichia coli]
VSHVLTALGKKTSQNLEQARKTELNVAGRKNAALFEWAAFVKAEKEELALRVGSVCRVLASMPHCG